MEGKTKKKEGVEKEEVKLKKAASVPKYEDFYFELKGKAVNIFSSGELIKGIIIDTSRYMIKVDVGGGKVLYLNKAYIQKISLI
jgi:hypothetical protein